MEDLCIKTQKKLPKISKTGICQHQDVAEYKPKAKFERDLLLLTPNGENLKPHHVLSWFNCVLYNY